MPHSNTFIALLQDRPGALNRVVSLLRRRGLNIESLTVQRTEQASISRMVLVIECDDAAPIVAQMEKLIDVLEVQALRSDGESSTAVARPDVPTSMFTLSQADGVSH